jgi:fructose-1,6-bisphosphatase/inositol monophosphatase family enzyme
MEQALQKAVLAGGMAAMGFYRGALQDIQLMDEVSKNPSTDADIQATVSILQTVHPLIRKIQKRLNRQYSRGVELCYFGEEAKAQEKGGKIKYIDQLDQLLPDDIVERILVPSAFFARNEHSIKVIFDGIDGTASFRRGIPLFCSAAAILLDDQVRVGAVYDPIHHTIFSGYLPGPKDYPEKDSRAMVWEIATGNVNNLTQMTRESLRIELRKEVVGLHFTRSKDTRLHDILKCSSQQDQSFVEQLAKATGGIYALNSGLLAMTEVASGGLGAFVNNITNSWDVAAGEVLIRACGGRVTDFNGNPIHYSKQDTSLVAAKEHLHKEIIDLIKKANIQI